MCILAGHKVPVIGRISMDLVTIDVTDVPEADSQPGAAWRSGAAHDGRRPGRACPHQRLRGHDRARPALRARLSSTRETDVVSIPVVTLLGRMTLALLATIGAVTAFAARRPPGRAAALLPPADPAADAGDRLLLAARGRLTAIFTGMVLALQSYTGFARFSAESAIPNVVVVSLTRELGPVLAG
jgi:hypothetical protein